MRRRGKSQDGGRRCRTEKQKKTTLKEGPHLVSSVNRHVKLDQLWWSTRFPLHNLDSHLQISLCIRTLQLLHYRSAFSFKLLSKWVYMVVVVFCGMKWANGSVRYTDFIDSLLSLSLIHDSCLCPCYEKAPLAFWTVLKYQLSHFSARCFRPGCTHVGVFCTHDFDDCYDSTSEVYGLCSRWRVHASTESNGIRCVSGLSA